MISNAVVLPSAALCELLAAELTAARDETGRASLGRWEAPDLTVAVAVLSCTIEAILFVAELAKYNNFK